MAKKATCGSECKAPQPPQLNYAGAAFGQIFWDQNNKIITALHDNDGYFRSEYMTSMFTHFGIEVKHHDEIPSFISQSTLIDYGIEEEYEQEDTCDMDDGVDDDCISDPIDEW